MSLSVLLFSKSRIDREPVSAYSEKEIYGSLSKATKSPFFRAPAVYLNLLVEFNRLCGYPLTAELELNPQQHFRLGVLSSLIDRPTFSPVKLYLVDKSLGVRI